MLFIPVLIKLATATNEVLWPTSPEDFDKPNIPKKSFSLITKDGSRIEDYDWERNVLGFWVGKMKTSEALAPGSYCVNPTQTEEVSPVSYKRIEFSRDSAGKRYQLGEAKQTYWFSAFKEENGQVVDCVLTDDGLEEIKKFFFSLMTRLEKNPESFSLMQKKVGHMQSISTLGTIKG